MYMDIILSRMQWHIIRYNFKSQRKLIRNYIQIRSSAIDVIPQTISSSINYKFNF